MDRLLHPGMRLMRRMGVTAKFGLVTVLLLLPLTIVVGTSFAESTGRLQAVDAERSGLRVAAPLVQLVVQLAQAQDAAARGLAPAAAADRGRRRRRRRPRGRPTAPDRRRVAGRPP